MSADNWAVCPKCRKNAEDMAVKLRKKADASYGKVTPDEYLELLKKANEPIKEEETLREDYSIGIEVDGSFDIEYSAHCAKCGLKYQYKHGEQVAL